MYKALEKVCTKIHEIKKKYICSGILFSEVTINGMDKGIQINEKIFTINNFISQWHVRVGVAIFVYSIYLLPVQSHSFIHKTFLDPPTTLHM